MKKWLIAFLVSPLTALSQSPVDLNKLLENASATNGAAYLAVRDAIVQLGMKGLPVLAKAASNPYSSWHQRLIARICYERIVRGKDIDNLRSYDWRNDPRYHKYWETYIEGGSLDMDSMASQVFKEFGLWYYYLEVLWKRTGEYAIIPFDPRINKRWTSWGSIANWSQPEDYYSRAMLLEDIRKSTDVSIEAFGGLVSRKEPEAVPFLIDKVAVYVKSTRPSTLTAEELRKATEWEFEKNILPFADSRHADLIEKFISEHPALAPLKDKVAELRKRPAPPPRVEPPFRLGTEVVKP